MANKSSRAKNEVHRKELKKSQNGQPVNSSFYIVDASGVRKKNPRVLKPGPRKGVVAKTRKSRED
jgi:hypothetical protein